jgi:hypothetical protein
MRVKIMKRGRAAARWIQRILDVRLPMDIVAGIGPR